MALSENINDLEKAKFREESGGTVVAVTQVSSAASGSPITTTAFTGSVTNAGASVPSSPGGNIVSLMVKNQVDNGSARRLEYSYDGGTNYFRLKPGDADTVDIYQAVTQIMIRATTATPVAYEIHLERS